MARVSDLPESLQVTRPTLLLDRNRAIRNIADMARKAETTGVRFRPHFKTHQSAEIGRWFAERGVECIAVSSLEMARYFARAGWTDITVAFPVNLLEMDTVNALAGDIDLGVLVDSEAAVTALGGVLASPVRVWIKVDTGYGRVGIPWDRPDRITSLAMAIQRTSNLSLQGVLTHSGHSYQAKSRDRICAIHDRAIMRLIAIKKLFETERIYSCEISLGDTPGCSLGNDFRGVDEIRPGNFVFYDVMQYTLGTCREDQIAVAVACPVVGKYEDRREIAIYGGGVHLSTECVIDKEGRKTFGYLTSLENGGLGPLIRSAPVRSLSQEHGIIQVDERLLDEIRIGDVVFILPVHSCLTSSLYKEYRTLDGEVISRL